MRRPLQPLPLPGRLPRGPGRHLGAVAQADLGGAGAVARHAPAADRARDVGAGAGVGRDGDPRVGQRGAGGGAVVGGLHAGAGGCTMKCELGLGTKNESR